MSHSFIANSPNPHCLRILHLSDILFEEKPGGSRQVARELLREQVKGGHDATLLVSRAISGTPQRWRDPECGNIAQYDKGKSPAEWIRNGREACAQLLTQAAQEGKPFDIVHTHFAYAAVGPLRAVAGAIPHIRSFYGPWDVEGYVEDSSAAREASGWKKPLLFARALAKRQYRHRVEADNLSASARVVILSEQSRGEVGDFGYCPNHVVKIPGGVNRSRFNVAVSDPEARSKARARVGLPEDAFPLLLSIRRLVPRMGLENLVAAFPNVRAVFPKAKLVIGGRGPLIESLEAQVRTLGVSDAVTFAGFIAEEEVVDYYRGADLFVLPTLSLEGFGLVTVESLACGTPVVATPVGAIPEVLGDLEKRLLTTGTGADAVASTILAFCQAKINGEAWARDLSAERLCAYVDARYTWAKHAHDVEAVYRSVLTK